MSITAEQKIDLLLKKLGYGVAKTDVDTIKSPSNESIASPLLNRGDLIWVDSDQIPEDPPITTTAYVEVYTGGQAVECSEDSTSSSDRTWLTNLTDWIPVEFGYKYQVKVWTAPAGTGDPTIAGTQLFPGGSGNNDSWYFDYQAGVLTFPDTNVPASVAGNSVFVIGYRYAGDKGFNTGLDRGFVSKGDDPSNWDTNYVFGLYQVNRSSWSGTIGTPTEAGTTGVLMVYLSENMVVQKYQSTNIAEEFVRTKFDTDPWSTWYRIVNDEGIVDGGSF